jgi:hypothetical protein
MPYAERADTARQLASGRAIASWVCFAGNLGVGTLARVPATVAASRADGARRANVAPRGVEPTEAVLDFAEEVLGHRKAHAQDRADYLDITFERLGLEPRVAAHRSRSVRSLRLPEGIDYATLHDRLNDEGYVIYAGLGDAAHTTFRVCALGAITVESLQDFAAALLRAMARPPELVSV